VSRCAQITRLLAEPMAGTAPSSARWLCLEWPDAWPVDVRQVDDPAARQLLARATASGFRPLLVHGARRRVLLTDTSPPGATTTIVERWADLALPRPGQALPGEPITGPLLLVCAHEQRDPCCGIDGRAFLDVLGGPDVVACSHLGGHRFAPTAMVLPTGYVYGHLDAVSARTVLARAAAGEVETGRCRGRCTWSPGGQVAELAVRAATGLSGPDDLVMIDDRGDTVHLNSTAGGRWAVDVATVEVDATRPASCGARPTLVAPLRAAAVRTLRGSRR
jgi:hypothetical protein